MWRAPTAQRKSEARPSTSTSELDVFSAGAAGMVTMDKKQLGDGSLHVTIAGKIDEKFDAAPVVDQHAPGKVVLHLGGVRSISSLGVRAFESFVQQLSDHEV